VLGSLVVLKSNGTPLFVTRPLLFVVDLSRSISVQTLGNQGNQAKRVGVSAHVSPAGGASSIPAARQAAAAAVWGDERRISEWQSGVGGGIWGDEKQITNRHGGI
jgi:hypothetical protein